MLWVNERATEPREAWRGEFASRCQLQEIEVTQLAGAAADGDWDVICFNIDYPEMGQLKLIPQTKHRWPSAPILLLTMQCSAELAVWALRVHVFDVLVKPLSPEEIDSCLQRVSEAAVARRSQAKRWPQSFLAPMPVEARYRPQVTLSQRLQQAVSHVGKNFGESLPESKMAGLCQMSPSRFCREFKCAFGMTYVDYVARYRVVQAKKLLNNPAMSIADAAAAVGFTDPSYFTRVFRKLTGLSPSAYRGCQSTGALQTSDVDFVPSIAEG